MDNHIHLFMSMYMFALYLRRVKDLIFVYLNIPNFMNMV